jgi:hypothetical protein
MGSQAAPRRRGPVIAATVVGMLVLLAATFTAGAAVGVRLADEGEIISVDPWDAFVDEEDWRSTPEEALDAAAREHYGDAAYTYLIIERGQDVMECLLGPEAGAWEYKVEIWRGGYAETKRWYAVYVEELGFEPGPVDVDAER